MMKRLSERVIKGRKERRLKAEKVSEEERY